MYGAAFIFKWSSVDQVLLPRGNLPDSQNICSDAAKIGIISESSKFLSVFSKKAGKIDPILKSFRIFAPTNIYNYGSNSIE